MSNRKRCEQIVTDLAKLGYDVSVDSNMNGLRIVTQSGNRDVSPRLSPKEMVTWLEGYLAALNEVSRITARIMPSV